MSESIWEEGAALAQRKDWERDQIEEDRNPRSDYWWHQRLDDAVFALRVSEGRCGNCGAFDGAEHKCPEMDSASTTTNPNS